MPEVIFNGSAGRLQGRYRKGHKNAPIALFMHAHPMFGGSMDNIVVYKLYHLLKDMGFSTLRFNFRGTGKSEGVFDFGPGELSDAADALNWAQINTVDYNGCWVVGYSFGAWIAMQLLMRRPEVKGFIVVSPPTKHDFSFLAPCPAPGFIVSGDNDKIAETESVKNLVSMIEKQSSSNIEHKFIEGANHFYTNKIDELMSTCETYIEKRLKSELKPKLLEQVSE